MKARNIFIIYQKQRMTADLENLCLEEDDNVVLIWSSFVKNSYALPIQLPIRAFQTKESNNVEEIKEIISGSLVGLSPSNVLFITNDVYCLDLCRHLRSLHGPCRHEPLRPHEFTDKMAMKKAVADAGLSVPKFAQFFPRKLKKNPKSYIADIENHIGYPLVVKPRHEANNVGVEIISEKSRFMSWA